MISRRDCIGRVPKVSKSNAAPKIKRARRRSALQFHFVVGNPAAFQALKPPAMERTLL